MYWLLSILIITVMIAVLAIASSSVFPVSLLSIELASISIWPYLLVIALSLIIISQRSIAFPTDIAISKPSSQKTSSIFGLFSRASYYLIIITLAILLIIGSGLQALSSQQRAENAKTAASMRVQALVTIEGISDSVYDVASNSGYRQVATISYIAPLITELGAEDLDALSVEQLQANSRDNDNSINNGQSVNYKVLLSAYPKITNIKNNLASVNRLQPGDQLLMSLTLVPLVTSEEAISNPTGFDSYRWLRGRHIDGVANILSVGTPIANVIGSSNAIDGSNPNDSSIQLSVQTLNQSSGLLVTAYPNSYLKRLRIRIDQGRWQLRQTFYQHWPSLTPAQQQARAVTLSLLTGDRSLINRETKDLYQLAGISHLLAISGTHVLFLAIMLAGLAVLIFNRLWPTLYSYVPRWQVRWGVMISAAFIYALFTGFDVPAARTAWMLLAIGAVRLTLLPVSTMRVLLALAVIMAWVDPYVLWQAGYWLSFVAVALILKYDNSLQQQSTNSSNNRSQLTVKQNQSPQSNSVIYTSFSAAWPLIKRLFKLQCWLFIALLPITLLLFGKASLWGLVINLFAIGLFGWVIVPLNLLAGLCYLLLPSIASSIWALVSSLVASLHQLITWLTGLPALSDAWLYTPVNTAILLMALLALLPWLLPRGLLSRWLALPPLSLLIMTVYANQQMLTLTPTLYVLPTNDDYVTAAVLQYPIDASESSALKNNKGNQQSLASVSWLVLADHRPKGTRTMASSLTVDKLSATVEQQLRTLSIKRLEGIVVQTGGANPDKNNVSEPLVKNKVKATSSDLLSLTAMQLTQSLPTKHYWQAGSAKPTADKPILISTQNCIAGKAWQSANGELSIKAITGWSTIADNSVWDCSLSIDSDKPIRILQFNAANPMQSLPLASQTLIATIAPAKTAILNEKVEQSKSRLVLDVATHQRLWQLWQLMCTADELAANAGSLTNTNNINNQLKYSTTWLAHSTSNLPSAVLKAQQVNQVISYDNKALEAAFELSDDIDINTDDDVIK